MLRMRRCRSIRILVYLFVLISISYLIGNYDSISFKLPTFASRPPQPPPPPAEHQSRPTYEYSTLYRLKANHTLETILNDKLLALEHYIRSTLPESERNLIANRKIWQIASPEEAEAWSPWVAQWRDNNKEWAYTLYTTTPTEFLASFSSIPTIAAAYETYPALRADLLRYLILWYHGGFYANIDTWARVGMRDCSPIKSVVEGRRNISLMIGVEIDEPYLSPETTVKWGWTRSFGFGQFVIWAPKRFDPMIRRAIVRAISHVKVLESVQDRSLIGRFRETEVYMGEVTGASMFTDVVLEVLSESLREGHPLRDRDAGLERRVTWKWFRKLRMPLWIEPKEAREGAEEEMRGLAVLPINRWSNGQKHSGAGNFDVEDACVNHVYGRMPSKKGWLEKLFG